MQCIVSGLFLKCVKTTDTGCYYHTHAVAVEIGRFLKLAVCHGLTGCDKRILSIKVKSAKLFTVNMLSRIEVLDFTGKLGFEFRSIEMGDRSGTAHTRQCGAPCRGHIIAYGCDGSKAGHNYSF